LNEGTTVKNALKTQFFVPMLIICLTIMGLAEAGIDHLPMLAETSVAKHRNESLSADSIVINQPDTFYSQHKKYVWVSLGIFITFFVLMIILAILLRKSRILGARLYTESEERQKAMVDLQRYREHMEDKVAERTAILSQTNRDMEIEITVRKHAVEALIESEERYRVLFEGSTHGIVVADIETKMFVFANPSICRMFGYSEEELQQLGTADIHPKDFLSQVMSEFEALVRGEKHTFSALPCLRKDGVVFYADIAASHIAINGRACVVGFFADVTERKSMMNELDEARKDLEKKVQERTHELEKSNEMLTTEIEKRMKSEVSLRAAATYNRRLFEANIDPFVIMSFEGKLTDVNQAAEAAVGLPRDELIGSDWSDYFTDHSKALTNFQKRIFSEGEVRNYELQLRHRNGNIKPVLCNGSLYRDESGKIIGVLGVVRDITERRQAERDRIAREAAEEGNRAKSIFVANMSHEIRTPMNAILGFAQVLERDPSLTPRQAEHVQTITRSGTHLLNLLNDILDMSKIEAGRTTLNETDFCLHDLLSDLELMFRSRADARGLQLLVERDESVPRYVTADEGKLRQILVNLLGNAVKFTETGRVALRVCVEAVEGKTLADKASLRLMAEVEDTGHGIPDTDRDRIFDPFQQAEIGVKSGGTGLGLAISRKFVEMMGGELTVTSQVGAGSCFRFEALLAQAGDIAEQEKQALRCVIGLEPGAVPFRILVVDDIPDNRTLLRELLRPVGFEIAEAGNGVEALDVFDRWSPHAVLMDMRMPIMDGYEATRRIKATAAGGATPVIAITASAFEDDFEQVMATGMYAYLCKPFRTEDLLEMLGKCLGLHYVFADDTADAPGHNKAAPLTAESITALPKDIVEAMQQAVEEGNMVRLTELVAQVEKIDSATARGLQVLTDRYDYEKLDQWLKKGGTDL
jgi:PAS domain S-box-containing protein